MQTIRMLTECRVTTALGTHSGFSPMRGGGVEPQVVAVVTGLPPCRGTK